LLGQRPLAAVLGCSDCRIAPEHLFDAGLGELYVVRVTGPVASDDAIASLEHAAGELGCGLILVLGHQSCEAVTTAVELHTRRVIAELRARSPLLAELEHKGRLALVAASYQLDSGDLEWSVEPAPRTVAAAEPAAADAPADLLAQPHAAPPGGSMVAHGGATCTAPSPAAPLPRSAPGFTQRMLRALLLGIAMATAGMAAVWLIQRLAAR
jgi:hypothetical protein